MRFNRWLLTGCLGLSACTTVPVPPSPTALQAQSVKPTTTPLTAQVIPPEALPQAVFGPLYQSAQAYADLTSKRRDIDYFRLHPQALGLRFETQGEQAWLFSLLGTALTRNDLNIELRILAAGGQTGMNLNYSGPVTQSRQLSADTQHPATVRRNGFSFELITGLPGNGVVEAYEAFMTGLARQLQQRYQARPMTFDDGPLVYALHHGEQLQGFLFLNQRNTLILGERKYADVQSVAFFTPTRELKAAYTLVGFNPKTAGAQQGPTYQWESSGRFGSLVTFGEH